MHLLIIVLLYIMLFNNKYSHAKVLFYKYETSSNITCTPTYSVISILYLDILIHKLLLFLIKPKIFPI